MAHTEDSGEIGCCTIKERILNIFVAHCSDLLTDYRPHGDGLVAYGIIRSLAERGHTLHVAVECADLRGPIPANVTIYQIPGRRAGARTRLPYMFHIRRLLLRLQKQYPIDLIHQLNPVFTGLSLSLAGSGIPLVLGPYVSSWPPHAKNSVKRGRLQGTIISAAKRFIADLQQRQSDAILLTTPAAITRLPRSAALKDRSYFLPFGIDADYFSPAIGWDSEQAIAADQANLTVWFFAHVWKGKGLGTLLSAFEIVANALPAVRLTVAGDGPDLASMKEQAGTLRCAERIDFVGAKTRAEAPDIYRRASLYCLPSLGEPFGMTALEAMSCARPLVVTQAGGLTYLVPREGGLQVPVGDVRQLATALIELLRDPVKRVAMGRFNRRLVEETMQWDSIGERLESIYASTLDRARSSKYMIASA